MSSVLEFKKLFDLIKNDFSWENDLIIIAGPTCVGKSAIAIELAKIIGGAILNADSVQVYKDLRLLSARPSIKDQKNIPHFLYGYVDCLRNFSVADWIVDLQKTLRTIKKYKKIPILVGGSGLYINAAIDGLNQIPNISDENKKLSSLKLDNIGIKKFTELNSIIDPNFVKINFDKQRLIRAYSVFLETKKNMTYWYQKPRKGKLNKNIFSLLIKSERSKIYKNCNLRFDDMIVNGALKEVKSLWEKKIDRALPISKSLGVKWLLMYLDNLISYEEAIRLSKRDTRRYVKRQFTWFNHNFIADKVINIK